MGTLQLHPLCNPRRPKMMLLSKSSAQMGRSSGGCLARLLYQKKSASGGAKSTRGRSP
jgi:hypothetical protein